MSDIIIYPPENFAYPIEIDISNHTGPDTNTMRSKILTILFCLLTPGNNSFISHRGIPPTFIKDEINVGASLFAVPPILMKCGRIDTIDLKKRDCFGLILKDIEKLQYNSIDDIDFIIIKT